MAGWGLNQPMFYCSPSHDDRVWLTGPMLPPTNEEYQYELRDIRVGVWLSWVRPRALKTGPGGG